METIERTSTYKARWRTRHRTVNPNPENHYIITEFPHQWCANSTIFSLSLHAITMTRNITQYPAKQLKLPTHWHNTERHVSIPNSATPSTNTKNWKISQNGKRTSFLQIIPPNLKQPKTSNQSGARDIQLTELTPEDWTITHDITNRPRNWTNLPNEWCNRKHWKRIPVTGDSILTGTLERLKPHTSTVKRLKRSHHLMQIPTLILFTKSASSN